MAGPGTGASHPADSPRPTRSNPARGVTEVTASRGPAGSTERAIRPPGPEQGPLTYERRGGRAGPCPRRFASRPPRTRGSSSERRLPVQGPQRGATTEASRTGGIAPEARATTPWTSMGRSAAEVRPSPELKAAGPTPSSESTPAGPVPLSSPETRAGSPPSVRRSTAGLRLQPAGERRPCGRRNSAGPGLAARAASRPLPGNVGGDGSRRSRKAPRRARR